MHYGSQTMHAGFSCTYFILFLLTWSLTVLLCTVLCVLLY